MNTDPLEHGDGHSWSVAAQRYAVTITRATDIAGAKVVGMANALHAITAESSVIDVGAGTGAVSLAVATRFPSAKIRATDLSSEMLVKLREQCSDTQSKNLKTEIADANKLGEKYEPGSFSHAFCNFTLQTATNDPMSVLRQMSGILTHDGVISIGVWGLDNDPYAIWEKACRSIDAEYIMPPPFEDAGAWRTELDLGTALAEAGLSNVKIISERLPFSYESAAAYRDFWFGAKNPGAQIVIDSWRGDLSPVKQALESIVAKEYDNGRSIYIGAVLGVGQKG